MNIGGPAFPISSVCRGARHRQTNFFTADCAEIFSLSTSGEIPTGFENKHSTKDATTKSKKNKHTDEDKRSRYKRHTHIVKHEGAIDRTLQPMPLPLSRLLLTFTTIGSSSKHEDSSTLTHHVHNSLEPPSHPSSLCIRYAPAGAERYLYFRLPFPPPTTAETPTRRSSTSSLGRPETFPAPTATVHLSPSLIPTDPMCSLTKRSSLLGSLVGRCHTRHARQAFYDSVGRRRSCSCRGRRFRNARRWGRRRWHRRIYHRGGGRRIRRRGYCHRRRHGRRIASRHGRSHRNGGERDGGCRGEHWHGVDGGGQCQRLRHCRLRHRRGWW